LKLVWLKVGVLYNTTGGIESFNPPDGIPIFAHEVKKER